MDRTVFTRVPARPILHFMAILKIARMGHPVLRRRAEPIHDPTDTGVRLLVADMFETLRDLNAAGLAAPQVHVARRLAIFHVPAHRAGPHAADGPVDPTVLINPVVTPLSEETDGDWEGCLSLPGMTGWVPRWRHVRYDALDLDGNRIEREASGFHARVVQHECDHLDGILYPQRMDDLSLYGFAAEIRRDPPRPFDTRHAERIAHQEPPA